jgi:DNA (cytosine-5)-methyltransferase 1
MTFKLLDLFSGIGGFSLGLERSGPFKTVAFCEIEPFPRAVLKKHWPYVPQYDDVRKLTAARLAADGIEVDAICGGFPCQDVSLAGRRAGLAGERSGLWSEYRRLISELRPQIVIVENTPGLLSKGMGTVLGDLAALGFDAEWHCLPASAVGARHARERVWIVAYPASERHEINSGAKWGKAAAQLLADRNKEWPALPDVRRAPYGLPGRMDRLRALGNAVVPQVAELIGTSIARAAQ